MPKRPVPGATTRNVLGEPLRSCSHDPLTGFTRSGCCETGPADVGLHVVCARVTQGFLRFSASRGNDLRAPHPAAGFPGLRPGDRWCLCAGRWLEALEAGVAPFVDLAATHEAALETLRIEDLLRHALPPEGSDPDAVH